MNISTKLEPTVKTLKLQMPTPDKLARNNTIMRFDL